MHSLPFGLLVIPLLTLIVTNIIAFSLIGIKKPQLLRTPTFIFTRKCLGIAILTYAASLIITSCIPLTVDDSFGWAITAQAFSWIAIIFTLRGLFETLSHPDNQA